jgi:hypothetical protein
VQGWTVDEAVEEMLRGGYGFHDFWREGLGGYLRELDFAEIKRQAAVSAEASPAGEG